MSNNIKQKIANLSPEKRALLELKLKNKQNKNKNTAKPKYQKISPRQNRERAPLSFAQQRLWFLDQLEPNSPVYNIPKAVKLSGKFDIKVLQKSLDTIVASHEVLHTNYIAENGNPIQVISTPRSIKLQIIDLQQYGQVEQQNQVRKLLQQESQRPFNLTTDMMLRGCLLKLASQEHILLLVMHHIASDGWSMNILWKQLTEVYQAFYKAQPNPLSSLPVQYADYALWQQNWLSGAVLEKQLSYWTQQLAGANPVLELPTDRPRPIAQTYRGASQSAVISETLTQSIKQLCRREKVTLYMTLLAAFQTLLYRYSKQEDIIVGSPISGRNRADIEDLIGFFVNTLVLRTDLSGNPSFQELLSRVRSVTLDAYSHQDLPFEKLVEQLQPERSLNHNPLFQVMFDFQNFSEIAESQLLGLQAVSVKMTIETTKFDLTLTVIEKDEILLCLWKYNTDLFDAATIKRMITNFQTLLKHIVDKPQQPIAQLPLLTQAEQHQLLVEWNNTQRDYPKDKCIHKLFEEQVAKTPDAVAVAFESQQLTYGELNNKANQLAYYLQSQGVKPETLVAICVERSLDMVIGLLAILKAGGTYVPLDPNYPPERIQDILEDSQASILLTQEQLRKNIPVTEAQMICLDSNLPPCEAKRLDNPASELQPDNLAYIIYTSGSTGKPKGVIVEHHSAVNLLNAIAKQLGVTEKDTVLAVTTISFDVAVPEIFLPLAVGAKLVVVSSAVAADGRELLKVLNSSQATFMHPTPVTWRLLLAAGWQGSKNLKMVSTGEALPRELANQLLAKGAELWNLYGPTEITVWATSYQVAELNKAILIGRPLDNTQIYILDAQQQPVPIGVPGELHIGGAGLARGYLNRPELTAEKFIWHNQLNSRLYQTGDLVRYLEDGNIEYLGRIDNQVKVRGFRIELGEIESVLDSHPQIEQAVVIATKDISDNNRLVAYIAADSEAISTNIIRQFLKQKLPEYMVPSVLMVLDSLPLTPNGKVDRKALPIPTISTKTDDSFSPPTEEIELKLTEIWSEVLDNPSVGIEDNFFDLGGHSLLAVNLFAQIEKKLDISLPLSTLFTAPTIEQLANIIRNSDWTAPWHSLVPIQTEGDKPPLFCVHGGGFNVLIYRELALNLGSNQPVYGLQAKGLDGKSTPHSTIEDMAADYVKYIREIQPEGPYLLAGLSNGGRIALEMAQQLHKQDQEVALLAMFDTHGPGAFKLLPTLPRLLSTLSYATRYSFPRFARKHFQEAFKIAARLSDLLDNHDKISEQHDDKVQQERLLSVNNDEKKTENHLNEIVFKFHRFILNHSPVGFYGQNIHVLPEELQKNNLIYMQARTRYVPQVYSGNITIFQASEQPPGFAVDSQFGWSEIAQGGLEIYNIPGHHTSIISSPQLANKLGECIAKALLTSSPLPRQSRYAQSLGVAE